MLGRYFSSEIEMSTSGSRRNRSFGGGGGASGSKRGVITASTSVSSDKGGKDDGTNKARPSVFSRLGIKGKDNDTPKLMSRLGGAIEDRTGKIRVSKDSDAASTSSSKKSLIAKQHHHSGGGKGSHRNSPAIDPNLGDWENWDEKNLDYDDELMLERKRQLLERELAKEVKSAKGTSAVVKASGTTDALSSPAAFKKTTEGKRHKYKQPVPCGMKVDSSSRSSSSSAVDSATSDLNSASGSDSELEGIDCRTYHFI